MSHRTDRDDADELRSIVERNIPADRVVGAAQTARSTMSRRDGRPTVPAHSSRGSRALMEDAKAKELLSAERSRVEGLLKDLSAEGTADRDAADEPGDMYDSAEPLTTEGTDDAIREGLEERLDAIARAEQRLAAGTYGVSVRSGHAIPDDRLEADPAAELTVEEAG